jgi:hypothetical protein
VVGKADLPQTAGAGHDRTGFRVEHRLELKSPVLVVIQVLSPVTLERGKLDELELSQFPHYTQVTYNNRLAHWRRGSSGRERRRPEIGSALAAPPGVRRGGREEGGGVLVRRVGQSGKFEFRMGSRILVGSKLSPRMSRVVLLREAAQNLRDVAGKAPARDADTRRPAVNRKRYFSLVSVTGRPSA